MLDMRLFLAVCLLFCSPAKSYAQYFQFSQYNFTPQRVNPAQVSTSDYATASYDYRNQATGSNFNLSSNIINVSYPFLARNGTRWSGIGLSLMDDRSGQAGIFNTKEIALSYSITVSLAKGQTLSLGVKGLYQSSKINLDGLYTGSQYVADRGFDETISNGENLNGVIYNYFTFSTGLYWQRVDKEGDKIAYLGASFFDFNKPQDSYLTSTGQLNSTGVLSLGFRLLHQGDISFLPEVLYTRNSNRNVFNVGGITRYKIKPYPNQVSAHVDLITKYVVGRSGILGLQFHQEKFSIGVSYDFPVIVRNVANTGAFEVGLEFRRLVLPKGKKERQEQLKKQQEQARKKPAMNNQSKNVVKKPVSTTDSSKVKPNPVKEDLSSRLKQKQDSVVANANAGNIQHEPLILEKATLHFNFEFNSTVLDGAATTYLNDLAKALVDNPELKIKLTGHTDNVGSEKFNLKLSTYRAQTLKDYLIEKGVDEKRITSDGKGMSEPLNKNQTPEDRAKNRRVELTILYEN